ncbi:MAG: DUF1565 domain-containing protein [Oscillatoriales cyanobacterium C42_A2020_001]|nr:DUF1565 domain-containing protein [Leptolyngbyaceae cyanobacterium C42_A2020_001]
MEESKSKGFAGMQRAIAWAVSGLMIGVGSCTVLNPVQGETECTAAIARVKETWRVAYFRDRTKLNPQDLRTEEFGEVELINQNGQKPANAATGPSERGVWFPAPPPQPTASEIAAVRQPGEQVSSPELQRRVTYSFQCTDGELLADGSLYQQVSPTFQQGNTVRVTYTNGRVKQAILPSGEVAIWDTSAIAELDSSQAKPAASPEVDTTPDLYVDPESGSDQASGTEDQPFKTITQAITQAKVGTVIRLRAGTYSADTGEVFPLQMKPGISLRGNGDEQGKGIQITGGGKFLSPTWAGQSVTIVANKDSQITGLTITNPNTRGTAVWVETGSPTIEQNRFVGSDREGVFVSGNATPKIWNNTFEQNGGNGLVFTRDSGGSVQGNVIRNQGLGIAIGDRAKPMLLSNQISRNKDGIVINGEARPELDSNQIEENGRDGIVVTNNARPILKANTFANNGEYDLHNATSQPLQLQRTNLAGLKVEGQFD